MRNNLYNNGGYFWWLGVVEDRQDPLFLGRCRVRIAGYHNGDKNELPIEDLPWAYPMQSISSAAISGVGQTPLGVVEGTWVTGFFLDGEDCQEPVIVGTLSGIPQPDIPGTVWAAPSSNTPPNAITTPAGEVLVDAETGIPATLPEAEKVPEPTGVIGPLEQSDLEKLYLSLRQRESSDKYSAVNPLGFLGAYQFGAAKLCDIGYLRSGAIRLWESENRDGQDYAVHALSKGVITEGQYAKVTDTSKMHRNFFCISDDSLWTAKSGGSAKAFLNSKPIQDAAIFAAFQIAYRDLIRRKILTNSDSKGKVGGWLFVYHLLGPGGAVNLHKGIDGKDANKTSGSSYYDRGFKAVNSTAPTEPSKDATGDDRLPVTRQTPIQAENAKINKTPQNVLQQAESSVGFKDPNEIYPKKEYLTEPDTNRLARHHKLNDTVVGEKDRARIVGVETALGGAAWDQPIVPYNASYPFNHVTESESGHTIEVDDTPGNERLHIYHKAGSWVEIDTNGTMVRRIVGDDYQILERNGNILIQGRANITIEGNCNLYVKNDINLQVDGNMNTEVHGDYTLNVAGKMAVTAGRGIHVKSEAEIAVDADKDIGFKTAKKFGVKADGDIGLKADGDVKAEAKGSFNAKGLSTNIEGTGKTSVKAGGILAMQSGAAAGITAGGILSLGGMAVALMSPGPPASSASGAFDPVSSEAAPAVESSSPGEPEHPTLLTPSRIEAFSFELDVLTADPEDNSEEIKATIQRGLDEGLITPEDLAAEVHVLDVDESQEPKKKSVIPGCGDVFMQVDFPPSFRLSTNITLGMVSTQTTYAKVALKAQADLSKADIVCNFKSLAENILEPIYAKYPNMSITSGFRLATAKRSQHFYGQATDLQFPGVSKATYFEIARWIRQALPFDQMILEYQTTGTGNPWIHISFDRNRRRGEVHTYNNHRNVYPSKLVNLA
jgi:hypothetical protein